MPIVGGGLECLLLALSGHTELHCTCPLLGVKRTLRNYFPITPNGTSAVAISSDGARTLDWLAVHAVDIEPISGLILRNLGIFQIPSGDFQPAAALKTGICNSETIDEFKKRPVDGVRGGNSLSIWRDWTGWLGRQDSNLGMAESKSDQFA